MSEIGKMACWMGFGKGFEIREYPVPDPEPGAVGHQGRDRQRLRLGHALLEGRAGLRQEGPPVAAEHRARAHGHGPQARRWRDHGLGRPAAPGGRPGHLPLLHPLRALQGLPAAQFMSCPTRQSNFLVSCEVWPHFQGGYGQYFYLRPEPRHLQAPGRDHRRDGGWHQLRLHPGLRRPRDRRAEGRRQRSPSRAPAGSASTPARWRVRWARPRSSSSTASTSGSR